MSNRAANILEFWFEEIQPENWFNANAHLDSIIRNNFEKILNEVSAQLRTQGHHKWQDNKDTSLALVILLDQFPRNIYRGTKGAFSYDDLALKCARIAIDKGHDFATAQSRRMFYYLPFMHSENIIAQNECVKLVEMRIDNPDNLFHAKAHRKLIERFGRFPHRNKVLGRKSSKEEDLYLKSGGYRP